MKCKVCGRPSSQELCTYHLEAKTRLEAAYPLWERAFGRMEWKSYLDMVKRDPQTGQWSKEMAKMLSEVS